MRWVPYALTSVDPCSPNFITSTCTTGEGSKDAASLVRCCIYRCSCLLYSLANGLFLCFNLSQHLSIPMMLLILFMSFIYPCLWCSWCYSWAFVHASYRLCYYEHLSVPMMLFLITVYDLFPAYNFSYVTPEHCLFSYLRCWAICYEGILLAIS